MRVRQRKRTHVESQAASRTPQRSTAARDLKYDESYSEESDVENETVTTKNKPTRDDRPSQKKTPKRTAAAKAKNYDDSYSEESDDENKMVTTKKRPARDNSSAEKTPQRTAAARAVKHIHIDSYSEESGDEEEKVIPKKKQKKTLQTRNKTSKLAARKKKTIKGKKKAKKVVRRKVKKRSKHEDEEDDEDVQVLNIDKLYEHRASNTKGAVERLRTQSEQSNKENENGKEYEVKCITGVRGYEGNWTYRVHFKDCHVCMDTWIKEEELTDCKKFIDEFWKLKEEKDKLPRINIKQEDFEVEKILSMRINKNGSRIFKIQWKGYDSRHNSNVREEDLNCPDMIEQFLKEQEAEIEEEEQSGNFEVAKILDINFNRDGTRDFLIRWKNVGVKEDTWEPEENLNCPELVDRYMKKVEAARKIPSRELRVVRKHTTPYATENHRRAHRTRLREGARISYAELE